MESTDESIELQNISRVNIFPRDTLSLQLPRTVLASADDADTAEIDETFDDDSPPADFRFSRPSRTVPNKSDVLKYFAKAAKFRIKSIGSEIQVTDLSDNPLFDVWYSLNCSFRVWTVEAFGKPILLMNEPLSACDYATQETRIYITDWNGDPFGSLVPGEPFYVHDADDRPVSRLVRITAVNHDANSVSLQLDSEVESNECDTVRWQCLSGDGVHLASLTDSYLLHFCDNLTLHLKLLTLSAMIRTISQDSSFSLGCALIKMFLSCCLNGSYG
ncbi:hypothetical protein T4E_4828 [Trichinella pseudospiralis]|uniref:Uncharacterized protein n=1 Tax=Trichinella pseudospiralis TaxID=6337 RepID=A0A0V1FK17_TRIPS|nr:hypothetical protein T4E_4828 [Trichinella pseudospiralis]KRY86390.1 hypothetical protein T4D_2349 [Trichinella pseudospiralis]